MLKNNPHIIFSRRAFTLMEILIAVIIVGLIASIALSKYAMVVEAQTAKEGEQLIYTMLASDKRDRMEKTNVTCSTSDLKVRSNNFTLSAGGSSQPNGNYFCYFYVERKGTAIGVYQMQINSQCGMGQANIFVNSPYVLYVVDEHCSATDTKVKCVSGQPNYCSQLGY